MAKSSNTKEPVSITLNGEEWGKLLDRCRQHRTENDTYLAEILERHFQIKDYRFMNDRNKYRVYFADKETALWFKLRF